jgi:hypothetical protein
MRTLVLLLILAASLQSCVSTRNLAERCAEEFPVITDTIVVEHWEVVNFPVLEYDTLILVERIPCPPGLTDTLYLDKEVRVTVPGRTIQVPVLTRDTIFHHTDTALRQAYEDLGQAYADLLAELSAERIVTEGLRRQVKDSRKPSQVWLWAIVVALAILVGVLIRGKW